MKDGAGCDTDGKGFGEAGLGVNLHLEDGEVGIVELAEGLSREAVLAGGGDGVEEEGLEGGNGFEGGLFWVQALGFVVGDHFLWAWCSSLLVAVVVCVVVACFVGN